MEAEKITWRKVFFIPVIVLLPIIFAIGLGVISHWASKFGLFYMRPELPRVVTILLFPLTWIYLGMRAIPQQSRVFAGAKAAANKFAVVTASILLLLLSVSTVMETASITPMANISRAFIVPDSWTEENNSRKGVYMSPGRGLLPCPQEDEEWVWDKIECPAIGRVWTKDQDVPYTYEELRNMSGSIGGHDLVASDNCFDKDHPWYRCRLSGKVDGVNVLLVYEFHPVLSNSHQASELHLELT